MNVRMCIQAVHAFKCAKAMSDFVLHLRHTVAEATLATLDDISFDEIKKELSEKRAELEEKERLVNVEAARRHYLKRRWPKLEVDGAAKKPKTLEDKDKETF